jgi:excisionase family DNA binding protein
VNARLELPDELVDQIADAVAERLADQLAVDARAHNDDGFLDVAGAARFLACPKSRIYGLVSSQRLPHHRDGSRLLFDRQELRAYVHNGGAKRT